MTINSTKSEIRTGEQGKFTIRISSDPALLLTLLLFCEKNIVRYFVLLISAIPVIGIVSDYIVPFLYIVLFLAYIKRYRIKGHLDSLLVALFVILSIVGTIFVYPINAQYILESNNFWNTIFPCVRYYLIALIICVNEETIKTVCKASCLGIIAEALFLALYMIPRGLLEAEDMSRAYQILPNVLIVIYYAFKTKRIFPFIFATIGIIYVFAMGTRGPVMVLISYIIIRIILTSQKIWVKTLITILLIVSGLVVANNDVYTGFLYSAKNLFQTIGLSTRVIDMTIQGQFISHLSDRDILFTTALQHLRERPYLGYGVYGEWQWLGWNVHNMYIEILIHFGVILGGYIILWMLFTVAKTYLKSRGTLYCELIIIWSCLVFVRGFFGGSYLNYNTAFLIGLCLNYRHLIALD